MTDAQSQWAELNLLPQSFGVAGSYKLMKFTTTVVSLYYKQ